MTTDDERKALAINVLLPIMVGVLIVSLSKILLSGHWLGNIFFAIGCITATYGLVKLIEQIIIEKSLAQSDVVMNNRLLLILLANAFIAIQIPLWYIQEFLSSLILVSTVFITALPLIKKGISTSKDADLPVLLPVPKKSFSSQFAKFFLYCILGIAILVLVVFMGTLAIYTMKKNSSDGAENASVAHVVEFASV